MLNVIDIDYCIRLINISNSSITSNMYISNIFNKYLSKNDQYTLQIFFGDFNDMGKFVEYCFWKSHSTNPQSTFKKYYFDGYEIIIDKFFKVIPLIQEDILNNTFMLFLKLIDNTYKIINNETKNISLYIINKNYYKMNFNDNYFSFCDEIFTYIYSGVHNFKTIKDFSDPQLNNFFYGACIYDLTQSPLSILIIDEKPYCIFNHNITSEQKDTVLSHPYTFNNLDEFIVEFSYFNNCELFKYISKSIAGVF